MDLRRRLGTKERKQQQHRGEEINTYLGLGRMRKKEKKKEGRYVMDLITFPIAMRECMILFYKANFKWFYKANFKHFFSSQFFFLGLIVFNFNSFNLGPSS
uniref:Transmembrane protein n=1 Tax=Cacopsylla melanoneura TaxID=428564 RepID=A0A8D8QZK1_9HEMI